MAEVWNTLTSSSFPAPAALPAGLMAKSPFICLGIYIRIPQSSHGDEPRDFHKNSMSCFKLVGSARCRIHFLFSSGKTFQMEIFIMNDLMLCRYPEGREWVIIRPNEAEHVSLECLVRSLSAAPALNGALCSLLT